MRDVHFPTAHRHFIECVSTNDLARAWAINAADPAPHGALVSADWQTRGRGRRGRGWDAPPGQSALMSFVLRPDGPLSDAWQFAFVAALAVAKALSDFHLEPRVKWPNDLLLHGAKVAGILVETVTPASPAWAAIIGIGVNVNQTEFPDAADYAYPPTSLWLEMGQNQSVAALIQATAQGLERWDGALRQQGWPAVREACQEHLAVGALLRRGVVEAALIGLNEDGSARVQLPDGTFSDWASVEGEVGANSV